MGTDQEIKICHIISGDLWAGAEVQAFNMISSIKTDSNIDLSVIILNEGKLADKLRETGVTPIIVDESKNGFVSIYRQAREHLKDKDIDIIHSHRYKENILAALLKRIGLTRHLVQTVHGLKEPFKGWQSLKAWTYGILDLYFTRKYFDRIQAVSVDIRNKLSRKLDVKRIDVIHNSVNPSEIVVSKNAAEIKKELGIAENQPLIGSAGRMAPVKGFDIFLSAAGTIVEKKPGCRFVLMGDGPELGRLKSQARELGISDKVVFTGFRHDIHSIISALDIFVISSFNEGIPTVALEAMELKRAVVSTNIGGMPEIIEDNVSGLLVNSGDSGSLAAACLKILDDPALKDRLAIKAERRVGKVFSCEAQGDRLLKLYKELVAKK